MAPLLAASLLVLGLRLALPDYRVRQHGLVCMSDRNLGNSYQSARKSCPEQRATSMIVNGLTIMPAAVGIGMSAAFLAGSALGDKKPGRARAVVFLCVGLIVLYWSLMGGWLFLAPSSWARLFLPAEGEHAARCIMEQLLQIFSLVGFFLSLQIVMAGALRGLGLQETAARIYIVANWVIKIPCAFIFGIWLEGGVFVIWYAQLIGPLISTVCFSVCLLQVNWRALAARVSQQLRDEGEQLAKAQAAAAATAGTA
eukprot:TRINITY_DN28364_c0_g4_i2.p2 TRINITY_DN28364_c0_g4~~TRINITY_DN28364_c0_g4_i2.p2  ORF type:complete len:255 (+),score=54.24 TRINITY_DN28364_c0_g4_i2:890-1654(+)